MASRAWLGAAAGLTLAASAFPACAQEPARAWSITPSIGVRGTYTDNVSLVASPDRGEFVTQVSPGIRIAGRGARFNASLDYTGSALFYARRPENDRLANTLSALASLEAVDNFAYIDATGNISQSFVSPFAPRPTDIATVTDNRAETRTFGLSPYLRGQILGGYAYELRNSNTWTTADNEAVADVHSRLWSGRLASPIRLFGWSVDGSSSNISYDETALGRRPDQESRMVRGRLYFQPDSTLRLSVSAGREDNNYQLQQRQSYDTYGYGVLWRPGPRTSFEFDWEHRFFGTSRLFSFAHRSRLTAWSASYSRNASTFQQELLRLPPGNTVALLDQIFLARYPNPVERQAAVQQFLRTTGTPTFLANSLAFYTQEVILQESLQGSMAMIGTRNSLTLTAFGSRSSTLSDSTVTLPSDVLVATAREIRQRGFGASASHRVTPFTSLTATANRVFSRSEIPVGIESRNDTLNLAASHIVSPKTTTFAGVGYTRFVPDTGPRTHARSAFAGLDHRF
jgi:uncharacterized protein (PEP-CTERM system associated)